MRTWLLTAPRWVHQVVSGGLFAVLMTVFTGVREDTSGRAALIGGVVGGVLFGLVMGAWSHRTARGTQDVIGALTPAERRRAARASWRGPVPDEPAVREAAVRMIDHQLTLYLPLRALTLVVGVLMLALYVGVALTSSPWWWAVAALWTAMIVLSLLAPSRLRRRRALLASVAVS